MSQDNGREELARRLHRIFIEDVEHQPVPDSVLLEMADDILAGGYSDSRWGPRPGDGGPPMKLVTKGDA